MWISGLMLKNILVERQKVSIRKLTLNGVELNDIKTLRQNGIFQDNEVLLCISEPMVDIIIREQ